jgi:hypothetical protein
MKKGDEYKSCTGSGCTKKAQVRGRITALQNICEVKRPLSNAESFRSNTLPIKLNALNGTMKG